ncbi:MAG TPA: cytochrome b N-terminal domain-containing protein [Actinomycetes bacterium]
MSSHARAHDPVTDTGDEVAFSWTEPSPWVRSRLVRNFPLRRLLPDEEPSYVSSLLYVMGVLTLAALIVVILSGVVLALGGVQWWQTSSVGGFMNSVHFWGVQLFFLFMAVHALFNFFIMAWRGGRGFTWVTGVLAFLLAIVTAFTGFLMMTNWDSQYIAQQAKDAMISMGIGFIWNVMDVGQQFTLHVVVTAGILGFIVLVHLGQVRRRGVVPPPGEEHLEVDVTTLHEAGQVGGTHA